jgi:hypothetical protein
MRALITLYLAGALLAVAFTRPLAADISCAEWRAFRTGDTNLQGQAPAFAAFIQGYIDAVNEYSDLLNRYVTLFKPKVGSGAPSGNFVPPQVTFASTAGSLDRLCSVFDPTDNAIEIGVEDVKAEMRRRARPIINAMRWRKMEMRHHAAPPPREEGRSEIRRLEGMCRCEPRR